MTSFPILHYEAVELITLPSRSSASHASSEVGLVHASLSLTPSRFRSKAGIRDNPWSRGNIRRYNPLH